MIRLLILLMLTCSAAHAHKLNIMASAENGTLSINSFYPDGRACSECAYTVTDSYGKIVAEGKLDKNGSLFKTGEYGDDLTVTVDAGFGHLAQEQITPVATDDLNEGVISGEGEDIRKVIRQELARQTAEIKTEMTKGRSNADKIIAGIGYILGIFGLIVILRKK